jgi:hypothetical protein
MSVVIRKCWRGEYKDCRQVVEDFKGGCSTNQNLHSVNS